MASGTSKNADSTPIVIALLFIWIILVLALLYFYKKLNAQTDGQYTVQRIVFAPGGLRDRLRQGVGVVENRLGVHIWPQQRDDEENIGGNDEENEEGEGQDKLNDSYTEEGEDHDDDRDDSSDDYSSVDLRERAKMQMEKKEEKNKAEDEKEKQKEEAAAAVREEDKSEEVKNVEKVELLVDLKPFTGSAIWSEETKDGNDMTAL